MTAAELAEATREFDHPLPASRYKPLTKAQRELFERMRRAGAPGRVLVDTLGLDSNLLDEATRYARRKKLTITQVVERGLRRELAVRD